MSNRAAGLYGQLKNRVWHRLVCAGRRNVLLRTCILAVYAVWLFGYHLLRNARTVPAVRYACLLCAGMLTLNCVALPNHVWAMQVETQDGTENEEIGELPEVAEPELEVTGPETPIVEGYQETLPYYITVTNPSDGVELTELEVRTVSLGDVYVLRENAETGETEEQLVYRHAENDAAGEGEESEENRTAEEVEESEENQAAEEVEESEESGTTEEAEESEESGTAEEAEESEEDRTVEEAEESEESGTTEEAEESEESGTTEEAEESEEDRTAEGAETAEENGLFGQSGTEDEAADSVVQLSLAPGEALSYVVRIPTGLTAGEYVETIIFQAKELQEPIERNLSFVVEAADGNVPSEDAGGSESAGGESSGDTVSGEPAPGESTGGESTGEPAPGESTGGESTGESAPGENAEDGVLEDTASSEGIESEETDSDENTNSEEETDSEEDMETEEETDPEEDMETEEETEEEPEEMLGPQVWVDSREGGYYMGNTFFAMSDASYELMVDQSTVAALYCELNGVSSELPVTDGCATFKVPEIYNGTVRFYTLDSEGEITEELMEYVIAEKTAPVLDYMNVTSPTNDTDTVRISLEDCGEIISGLNQIECMVDDVPYTGYQSDVYSKTLLCSGEEVVSGLSFDIPLQDNEIHTIRVVAMDNVGNVLDQSFRVHTGDLDVVSVVLPTSFGMTIFPYASNGNIWGEDIVIANQSEFPVEVTLKSVQVDIDHTLPDCNIVKTSVAVGNTLEDPVDLTQIADEPVKDAKLNLNINLSEERSSALELQEGFSMPGDCFILEARNPDTDAAALQSDKSEKQVASGDYAIVNVRGVISEGSEYMWKDGDIAVALTFTFKKLEEAEQ